MTDNQLSRRNQNRTFADSVITGLNQLTSSSNNNTYRNNYSSNQDTNRYSARNRVAANKNRISSVTNTTNGGALSRRQQYGAGRREDLRSDIDEESDSQDLNDHDEDDDEEYAKSQINQRVEEDEEDKDISPEPFKRGGRMARDADSKSRSRSNNNRFHNENHNTQDHNLDSSEFSNVDSFTQTQYSKISHIGKSKLFGKVKGEDLDLTEDEYNASVMKKSPIGQRFRNLADNESLSLTPASVEGKWQNQKSIISNNKAINRTLAVDNKSQLNAKFNSTNLHGILGGGVNSNLQNINTLNLTELGS